MKINLPQSGGVQRTPKIDPSPIAQEGQILGQLAGSILTNAVAIGKHLKDQKTVTEFTAAEGHASKDLSALKAKLITANTFDRDEIPDNVSITDSQVAMVKADGSVENQESPFVHAHDVAINWWESQAEEIIEQHAATISDPRARERFVGEMRAQFVAKGLEEITKASIIKQRSYAQANANMAIENILSSDLPAEEKEEKVKSIVARSIASGVDPSWGTQTLQALGGRIDALDFQQRLLIATDESDVTDLQAELWEGNSRMSITQMRSIESELDQKIRAIEVDKTKQRQRTDRLLTRKLIDGSLRDSDIDSALRNGMIEAPTARTLHAAMATTKPIVSDQNYMNSVVNEILQLPYTAGTGSMEVRADALKKRIVKAAAGLSPNNDLLPLGAPIAANDADRLLQLVDNKVASHYGSVGYKQALGAIKAFTRIEVDPITGAFSGSQHTKDAYSEFKQALDNYVDAYGAEADPMDFYKSNRSLYDPDLYLNSIAERFRTRFPVTAGAFEEDKINLGKLMAIVDRLYHGSEEDKDKAESIYNMYRAYYEQQGIAPAGIELELENLSMELDHD